MPPSSARPSTRYGWSTTPTAGSAGSRACGSPHRAPGHRVSEPAPGTLFSLLIPAVGGQGGGVLAEWIVEAALHEGHLAHATSIPGVAQRTGSTTYYVEVFT